MTNYVQMNILELLAVYEEQQLQSILSHFICPKKLDVEDFIHNKAIEFAKQRIAITYLIFSNSNPPQLLGYFTLANKFVSIVEDALSKTLRKRIQKFAQYDSDLQRYFISMPLIAQLGKNFSPSITTPLPGKDLLNMACTKVQEAQAIIGGKTVYIECANNPKLFTFYSSFQFTQFGQRTREKDELSESPTLVQMLKYLQN